MHAAGFLPQRLQAGGGQRAILAPEKFSRADSAGLKHDILTMGDTRPNGRPLSEEFGCDPKVFTYSQPVRVPGAFREGRLQRLIWLEQRG